MKTRGLSILVLAASLAGVFAAEEFTAHEWGTFTSVQGADGVQVVWNPFAKTDLPGFVYDRFRPSGFPLMDAFTKSKTAAKIRMETPVIYFYSDQARTVDVSVEFPAGRITEWYPQATGTGPFATTNLAEQARARSSFIEWRGVNILPRDTAETSAAKLIREKEETHYYPARETDANFLRMNAPKARGGSAEYDRLLFYRGVGDFTAPLTVRVAADEAALTLSTANLEPLTDLFVLTIRGGKARYQFLDRLASLNSRTVPLGDGVAGPLSDVRERLMAEMRAALVRQGLFEKEALAMVNTWKDQWFAEEGTRVLYLLPRLWTDRVLPLDLTPRPAHVERVMVGRAEVILPEVERTIAREIDRYQKGGATEKALAAGVVRELALGRFLEPAVRRVLAGRTDQALVNAAWKLAAAAGVPPARRPQVAGL
jgi:hypothetical protein